MSSGIQSETEVWHEWHSKKKWPDMREDLHSDYTTPFDVSF